MNFSLVRRKLGEEMTLDKFEGFRALAARLDQLMNLDIVCRGAIEPLYEPAARVSRLRINPHAAMASMRTAACAAAPIG